MVPAPPRFGFWYDVHSRITKKPPRNLYYYSVAPNHRKVSTIIPKRVPIGTPNMLGVGEVIGVGVGVGARASQRLQGSEIQIWLKNIWKTFSKTSFCI